MARTTRRAVPTSTTEAGTGLVGTVAGVTAFLVLLLFAVQLLFNLYATSVVTAAAFDAARIVASAGDDPTAREAAVPPAEEHARRVLGDYGDRVQFEWRQTDDVVALHVHADNRSSFVRLLAGLRLDAIQQVDRTVRVRVECFREASGCRA